MECAIAGSRRSSRARTSVLNPRSRPQARTRTSRSAAWRHGPLGFQRTERSGARERSSSPSPRRRPRSRQSSTCSGASGSLRCPGRGQRERDEGPYPCVLHACIFAIRAMRSAGMSLAHAALALRLIFLPVADADRLTRDAAVRISLLPATAPPTALRSPVVERSRSSTLV